jgi:hypothetical protein
MYKQLHLRLNKYAPIPLSLRDSSNASVPVSAVTVDLANLYHHYYWDTFGVSPPNPDPAYFEHTQFMTPGLDLRLVGRGIGASTSARRAKSAELGQAFCRWFLHDHLGMTYFAHISELLDRQGARGIGGCSIQRSQSGDTPDYFCAQNASNVYLAEAKGRYTSVGFATRAFDRWRDQFSRVRVLDSRGIPRAVKGHIVATRFATESDSARVNSTIFAEDPSSPGEGHLNEEATRNLASAVIGLHYARVTSLINQPLLATALRYGIGIPRELLVRVILWKLSLDTNDSRLFVGGYYPGPSGQSAFEADGAGIRIRVSDPLRLDQPRGTFVGVELGVFRTLVAYCRADNASQAPIPIAPRIDRLYSAISMLRDGSVIGPVDLFTPISSEAM